MTSEDKLNNKVQQARGKAKEVIGRKTNDPDLEAQGRTDQAESKLKQAGENVKDAFKG